MAMIGRNAAVAEVGKHRHQVEGPVAFAAWLGVHAMLLSGAHSKTDAFLSWAWDYFDRDHAAVVEARPHLSGSPGVTMPPTSRTSPSSAKPRPSTQTTPEQDGTSGHDDAIIVGSGALAYCLAPSRTCLLVSPGWASATTR